MMYEMRRKPEPTLVSRMQCLYYGVAMRPSSVGIPCQHCVGRTTLLLLIKNNNCLWFSITILIPMPIIITEIKTSTAWFSCTGSGSSMCTKKSD